MSTLKKYYEKVVTWYHFHRDKKEVERHLKAAEQGDPESQYMLACYYKGGYGGLRKDPGQSDAWFRKAVEGWRKAAEQGDAEAQLELGCCYLAGRGVEQDEVQAIAWFRKAAEQGNWRAQALVGVCYHEGHGVKKDARQTAEWYSKARKTLRRLK